MKKIILASASPRRRELLAGLDIEFEVDTRNTFEESIDPSLEAHEVPAAMAEGKSEGFWRELSEDEILITADTVVIIDGKVLGKPHSREEAFSMLRTLSGRTHEVVTSVVIRSCSRKTAFSDSTLVTFAPLSDDDINYYIDKYKPFDKAGAYGVQEWIGYAGITRLEGSYFNVMGFPVARVREALLQELN